MIVPSVHSNGTGWKSLLDDVNGVSQALRDALDKMSKASPHPRDYYVQDGPDTDIYSPDSGYTKAKNQWQGWYDRVNDVLGEMSALSEAIYDKAPGRPGQGFKSPSPKPLRLWRRA